MLLASHRPGPVNAYAADGGERRERASLMKLLALMAAFPLLVWLPSHWVLLRLFAAA